MFDPRQSAGIHVEGETVIIVQIITMHLVQSSKLGRGRWKVAALRVNF
jgi:hypothetical protein